MDEEQLGSCDGCVEYIHSTDDEELHLALLGYSSKLARRPVQLRDLMLETLCSVRRSNCLKALADGFQPHMVGDFETKFDRAAWTSSAPHQTKEARGKIGPSLPQKSCLRDRTVPTNHKRPTAQNHVGFSVSKKQRSSATGVAEQLPQAGANSSTPLPA